MKFHDFTITRGRIRSRRIQDTTALVPGAVAITDRMLRELRAEAARVEHGIEGLPPIELMLGLPLRDEIARDDARLAIRMAAPGRFFCAAMPGAEIPFQLNLVLPRDDTRADVDRRAIATLLGLSMPERPVEEPMIEELWAHRPFLATTVFPAPADPETVRIAADLSTCFAASMLRHPR